MEKLLKFGGGEKTSLSLAWGKNRLVVNLEGFHQTIGFRRMKDGQARGFVQTLKEVAPVLEVSGKVRISGAMREAGEIIRIGKTFAGGKVTSELGEVGSGVEDDHVGVEVTDG